MVCYKQEKKQKTRTINKVQLYITKNKYVNKISLSIWSEICQMNCCKQYFCLKEKEHKIEFRNEYVPFPSAK